MKERLVADLIDGRDNPRGGYRGVPGSQPRSTGIHDDSPGEFPGLTDEERTARNVISYAAQRSGAFPPARQAEVMARLESEFTRFVATTTANLH